MSFILLAIGLVLVVEGLVFALAPFRIEDILEAMRAVSPETRRYLGLGAIAVGVALIWMARILGL